VARTSSYFKTSIWSDEFRALPSAAQHLYISIWTSAGLSYAGVADWRPARLAKVSADLTPEKVVEAGLILHHGLYIVVDEETEEVLIRTFIRNDGLMDQPNVAAAMVRDYGRIASPAIRGVIVYELQRLFEDAPELKGWRDQKAGKDRASLLLPNPSVNPSLNPTGWGSGNPSPNPPELDEGTLPVTHASLPSPNSLLPTPSPHSPSGPAKPASIPRSRGVGTRIPDPFTVDEAMKDWAIDRGYTAEWCMAQTERFINYWSAKPGKDGTKSDWRATWRNWILKAADDLPPYSGLAAGRTPPSPKDGLFDRAMERATNRLEIVQ
jgi:hypothetical protein